MLSTARGIIRHAVMELRFKERCIDTYNKIAIKCKEQMQKHFNGNWHCHTATAGQYSAFCHPISGTLFNGSIDGLDVVLYQTSTN